MRSDSSRNRIQQATIDNVQSRVKRRALLVTYRAVSSIELRNPSGFDVCCQGSNCSIDYLWIPANITSKSGLTVTVTVPSLCVGKQLVGLHYLWRSTPCLFKQAGLYSGTDQNLPSPPYMKLF